MEFSLLYKLASICHIPLSKFNKVLAFFWSNSLVARIHNKMLPRVCFLGLKSLMTKHTLDLDMSIARSNMHPNLIFNLLPSGKRLLRSI